MLHHQHPVHPIPRNQLRDGNNVNRMAHPQMSMRLPQPGMGGQQRPPHPHNPHLMMGMQPPQPNVPGVMVPMATAVMAPTAMQHQSMQPVGKRTGPELDKSMMRMQGQMTPVSVAAPAVSVPVVPISTPAHTPVSPAHPKIKQQQTQQQQASVVTQATPSTEVPASSEEKQPNTIISNNLANTKEKTPMCLINELARFNKITHQYRLTSETGPAHKKRFTVTLKLGEEEYAAEGPSIKKAQHSAAADALASTRYEHPPPKTQRVLRVRKVNITPTVELNALAMKRGEPTSYNFLEPIPPPYPPNFNFRGMSYQRYHYNKPMYGPSMFYVTLRVGEREYSGQGRTAQSARHDAATKALLEIRQLPLPEGVELNGPENGEAVVEVPVIAPVVTQDPGSDLKSPISLVHEMALKRSLSVSFEVVREKGPPHMRSFLTSCRVGDIVTEGEGNSKKTSKKRAAEQMLDELKKLPPVSPPALNPQRMKRKPAAVKKKTRNLIKQQDQKAKPEYTDDVNPISRLIQIQQAKKEREPEYTLIEERGVPRRREFVMEVSVGLHSCTGSGPNKKLAKRAAADALLQMLGYSSPTDSAATPHASSVKSKSKGESGHEKGRKVTFSDEAGGDSKDSASTPSSGNQPGGSGGRQLVPGLLLMTDAQGFPSKAGTATNGSGNGGPTRQTAAVIAKELLSCGSSPTAEALVAAGHMQLNTSQSSLPATPVQHVPATTTPPATAAAAATSPRPKELLNYLSNLLKFSVHYTDFPKVNHSEFLSLVSLSTTPPQVFHGAGPTTDASHDQAARNALQVLSELGLDAVNSSADTQTSSDGHTTDGIHMLSTSKSAVTSNGK